jgi:hypothetical protein
MNMHGDHVASCLCCRWLNFDYESDWSEVTPGMGDYCECKKKHFVRMSMSEDLHLLHVYAPECPDFQARDTD